VKPDGSYDYTALTESMVNVKKEFPSESKVIVGAEGDIAYEVLVSTMDAIRETPAGWTAARPAVVAEGRA
jgi:biopolymer transport protein ExbD